jgi:zinc protease
MQVIRKQTVLAAAALALFTAPAAAQTLPPAQQVVDRYVQAIGGRDKARSFQSRRLEYEMNISGTVIGMNVAMRRPNFGTVVMQTPMGEIRSGVNGDVVWAVGPMGAQRLDGAQAEDIRIRTAFDADILYDIYPTMETVERAEYGGKPCWKVRMETTSGTVMHRCFDVQTGLMVATIQSQNGVEVTAIFDEYKEVDGLKYPAHSTASAMGQTVETTLVSVSHADIPVSEFAVPDEVQ